MDRIDDATNLRMEARSGVLTIWHRRPARDVAEVEALTDTIDRELRRTGCQHLLFDARDADRADEQVMGRIWAWLGNHDVVQRVAVVMHARERDRAVRMTGADQGVRVKVFAGEEEARKWLLEL